MAATSFYFPDKQDPYHVSRHAESKMAMKLMVLAEKNCAHAIEAFNECARGRNVSMLWACRSLYTRSQECIHVYINDANLTLLKKRWVDAGRPRKPDWTIMLAGMDVKPPLELAGDAADNS